jgi:hypothetical protein
MLVLIVTVNINVLIIQLFARLVLLVRGINVPRKMLLLVLVVVRRDKMLVIVVLP